MILPAFVVGFELSDVPHHVVDDWDDSPDWLLTLDQQAGGYCMSYPTVVGVVLRFCDNGQSCSGNVGTVVRGFEAMAEDPNLELLRRDYPTLERLVYTSGECYSSEQLLMLHRFVIQYFNIPKCTSGVEAFVRLAECDPMHYFNNWNMLHAATRSEPRQLYRHRKSIYIDESNIGSLELTAKDTFDSDTLTTLRHYGERLKMDNLGVYLLWENSD